GVRTAAVATSEEAVDEIGCNSEIVSLSVDSRKSEPRGVTPLGYVWIALPARVVHTIALSYDVSRRARVLSRRRSASVAMPRPNPHPLCIRLLVLVVMVLTTTFAIARPREARADGVRKSHRQHAQDGDGQDNDAPTNVLLESAGAIALPGRGLSLAWSPDG